MCLRVGRLGVAAALIAALAGCGDGSSSDDAGDARGAVGGAGGVRGDDAGDARSPDAPGDAPSTTDLPPDAPTGIDLAAGDRVVGTEVAPDTAGVDTPAGCTTQTISLARGGTTSACSFKVSTTIPRDRVNVSYGGRRLCRQGSNNCTSRGGWFWFGDDVALCDATCVSWEESRALLVVEVGCPSESCFVACREQGGPCGDGINACCAGWRCTGGTCAACGRGGQACAGTADCCTGMTCQNGACVGGLGSPCVSQAGCTQGQCREGRCQCAADEILCNSGCVSFLDPKNCRGCGNVCPAGRVCTANGCACDPATGLPDDCNGTCVNRSTDRTNCGLCSLTCPRLEQVCTAGRCGCPAGQTDCNGSCVDTATSQTHCGTCNRGCPVGTEVCSGGSCACAPGFTRCAGTCVNLMTNRLNCGSCGVACPGNKTCSNGAC